MDAGRAAARCSGEDDGAFAARVFGVTEQGTFEHGTSVLQRRADPQAPAPGVVIDPEAAPARGGPALPGSSSGISPDERLDRIRGLLLTAREGRTRPARDDKVVAAWNGMAIGALAEAGVLFGRPDLVDRRRGGGRAAGRRCTISAGRIVRTSRDGVAGPSAGLLEDYACVAAGLLRLAGVTGEDRWAAVAGALLDTVLAAFGDGNGGFYDTADDGERLIFRPADPTDNATPSGAFAAADALLSYGALTGEARYTEAARGGAAGAAADRRPLPAGRRLGLSVAEALLSGPAEIAIVGPDDDPRTADLLRAALHAGPAGRGLRARLRGGARPVDGGAVPLLAGRPLVSGGPAGLRLPRFHLPGTGNNTWCVA